LPVITGGKERLFEAMAAELLPRECGFTPPQLHRAAEPLIELAVREDVPDPDLVDARMIVDRSLIGEAVISANTDGALAGGWIVGQIAPHYSKAMTVEVLVADGTYVRAGQQIAMISGPVASIVMAERIFLNFLSRLSGIATMTSRCVQAISGTGAVITDTRKTMPAYRILDKYAVRCGGGTNHRLGLCDGVMIKDNHIAAMDHFNIPKMVRRVRTALRRKKKDLPIWVEVDRIDQLIDALEGRPDVILLDNMSINQLRNSVAIRNDWFARSGIDSPQPVPLLEASGGVDLSNIADVARTGIDRIAVGALTHSAPALDLTLELQTATFRSAEASA